MMSMFPCSTSEPLARKPAVDGTIVGFRRPDQVDPILTAANLDLTDEDIAEIEGAHDEH
jgi:aryl-alcohol dehydrogenase-like predicted oxidoreductase